jgi:EAL domain-containing protein (putative c-di-GMP-specific phosphodiesterase class I)
MAVNVSPRQLQDAAFAETVARCLAEHGLCPADVELEITETVVLRSDTATSATIASLQIAGMGFALDDFGTGYSSLSYLNRFRFRRVKIDRSFVNEIRGKGDAPSLAHGIVAMAKGLGVLVTAEGVETLEQARVLRRLGCHEMQGHLFSEAVASEAFAEIVAAGIPAEFGRV